MELMFQPFKKYFQFSGRSRRKEYWLFMLLFYSLSLLGNFLVFNLNPDYTLLFYLYLGVCLGLIIPAYTVAARRLHDIDRTAWWILINLIPFGFFVLLIFYCQEGTKGENQYGADPKGFTEEI